jgi:hypothetical protein
MFSIKRLFQQGQCSGSFLPGLKMDFRGRAAEWSYCIIRGEQRGKSRA